MLDAKKKKKKKKIERCILYVWIMSHLLYTLRDTPLVILLLTCEFCPADRGAADGMSADTSKPIVKQLPVTDSEAQ